MPEIDVRNYAPNLERDAEGWWMSKSIANVSYHEAGNALCFQVEESSFWFKHRNRCIVEALNRFPPCGAIFDVGGGNGFVASAIQESGLEVVLVEPGVAGARNAIQRGIRQVVRSTLEDAGILEEALPAVGLFDVIEHVREDAEFMTRLRRLLVPGGHVYMTTPAYGWLWSEEDVLAGHFRRYSLSRLTQLLERSGYAIDFATYIFGFLPVPILLRRVVPYRLGVRAGKISERTLRSDHEIRQPVARKIVQCLSRRERSRIAARRPLGSGASCLVVASKSRGAE